MDDIVTSSRYISPLRYPGGKAAMAPWLAETFAAQCSLMDVEIWMEPFAGGAGAALTLLDRDAVGEAWLVDLNPGIAAFWMTVVTDGEALAHMVERTAPTMDLYERSRTVLAEAESTDPFHLAYAAFIVNRCSRSGIVGTSAGPMGGWQQSGDITVSSRFNAPSLADRIRHVATFRSRLRVVHGDGIAHIEDLDGECGIEDELMLFVDPPYVREGPRLYANGFTRTDHERLAAALNTSPSRWLLTYDDEPLVSDVLYRERRVIAYDIRNTANRARVAREYAVLSDNLHLESAVALTTHGDAQWLRAA